MTENELSKVVIGLCIKIHGVLGPGLLESVYEKILSYELTKAGIQYERQKVIGVSYEGVRLDMGFRADIIVDKKLIVELKCSESVTSVHHKVLLTYLRMTDLKRASYQFQ